MQRRVLITDVDNTLLDWQDLWYQTFSAMIEKVIEISGVDRESLYSECSVIHQRYGTSEYSRLLEELPCLQALYGNNVLKIMEPAIDAFRNTRRRVLQLYPTVAETLRVLKASGVTIAAFTESKAFYTSYSSASSGSMVLLTIFILPKTTACRKTRRAPGTTSRIATTSKRMARPVCKGFVSLAANQSASTYPASRAPSGQDGDTRAPVLINFPASSAVF